MVGSWSTIELFFVSRVSASLLLRGVPVYIYIILDIFVYHVVFGFNTNTKINI
ncbi:MAG: hypothetical protein ACKPKO_62390 [Candidatus Fonsibacter sp.]